MTTDATTPPPGRDGRGRFQKGNAIARGNGVAKRMRALSAALDGVSDDDVGAVLRKLHEQAVAGDTQAASLWLQHVAGRPRERQPEVAIELEDLDSAEGIATSFATIAKAAASGLLEPSVAKELASVLQSTSDAVVLRRIEQQLQEAQQKGGTTDTDAEAWRQMQRAIPGRQLPPNMNDTSRTNDT